MTNAEKYLKDNVSVEEFANEIGTLISNGYSAGANRKEFWCVNEVEKWLEEQVTPTLTEDERVILKNIKDHPKYIARQKGYGLMAYDEAKRDGKTGWSYDNGRMMSSFSHLFQFIKERRRIRDKRIIGGKIK
ncbi:MAG: hypothetical protein J6T10_25120 [Methanobrevibacter sp.]|nr:hypothetical protein [Methanobrevibacter sp.]